MVHCYRSNSGIMYRHYGMQLWKRWRNKKTYRTLSSFSSSSSLALLFSSVILPTTGTTHRRPRPRDDSYHRCLSSSSFAQTPLFSSYSSESTEYDNGPYMKESEIFEIMYADYNQPKLPRDPKLPKRTALYDFHKDIGCTFTTYDGYEVPLFYHHSQGGILKEHLWCRTPNQASIFDISYLTQYRIFGKDRIHFLERLMTADLTNLPMDHAAFTCLTHEPPPSPSDENDSNSEEEEEEDDNDNDKDGESLTNIIDTGIVSKCDDNFHLVVNGDKMIKSRLWEHFVQYLQIAAEANVNPDTPNKHNKSEIPYEYLVYMYTLEKTHSLIAIQGSGAAAALQALVPSDVRLDQMTHMSGIRTSLMDVESCRITRCGYTGMDGFELSIPHAATEDIVVELLRENPTTLNVAGLGARNTLRCESGLLQYGIDIHPNKNRMIETGYDRTIPRRRKEEGGFLGSDHILAQLHPTNDVQQLTSTAGTTTDVPETPKYPYRNVGIIGMDRIVTANTIIYDGATGTIPIGHVTSGVFSPTLQRPIAMGYVLQEYSMVDTPIQFHMTYRNGRTAKRMNATITQMPFVPTTYYRYERPLPTAEEMENAEEVERQRQLREPEYSSIPAKILPYEIEPRREINDNDPFDMFNAYAEGDEFFEYSSYVSDNDDDDDHKNGGSSMDDDGNDDDDDER